MKVFCVRSFGELHDTLRRYSCDNRWKFRGHSNPDWQLIPKVGRPPFAGCDDRRIFEAWKRRAIEYVSFEPRDDWEWLAIAQHHGLATRLLDWTYNPLAAAFFAVCDDFDAEAVIFAYRNIHLVAPESEHPLDVKGVLVFKPMGVVPRITRQGGLFTVHGEPSISMERLISGEDILEKIVIDQAYRRELIFELSQYGINRATLFPDLDGLSSYVNWATSNRERWKAIVDPSEAV